MNTRNPTRQWATVQHVYQEVFDELSVMLSDIHIPHMPIKGQYLICTGLSEKLRYRKMTDIDILILPEDMEKATNHLFAKKDIVPRTHYTENYRTTETQFYYLYNNTRVAIEIHCSLNFPDRFILPTENIFKRGKQMQTSYYLPCPEDALLLHLCHLLTHISFEFRSTIFEEITLISGQDEFSWKRFFDRAQTTGIVHFIYFVLTTYSCTTGRFPPGCKTTWYTKLQAQVACRIGFNRLPQWYRRLFMEMPFVRKPGKLIARKLSSHSKNKTQS